jgi:hypothetical protein
MPESNEKAHIGAIGDWAEDCEIVVSTSKEILTSVRLTSDHGTCERQVGEGVWKTNL